MKFSIEFCNLLKYWIRISSLSELYRSLPKGNIEELKYYIFNNDGCKDIDTYDKLLEAQRANLVFANGVVQNKSFSLNVRDANSGDVNKYNAIIVNGKELSKGKMRKEINVLCRECSLID